MNDLYNVSYTRPDTGKKSMGVVRQFYKEIASKEDKAVDKRGNLVVDDSIEPLCFELSRDQVKVADFDQAHKFVEKAFTEATKKAPKIGFKVGCVFNITVGDGRAFYIVTGITNSRCEVQWRGFGGGDRYTDHWLGWGGVFPTNKIKPYVLRDQFINKFFGTRKP